MSEFRPDSVEIARMYGFLTAQHGELPEQIDVTFIFGRKSRELGRTAAIAVKRSQKAIVSGEVGKDSGNNPAYGIREDHWLLAEMYDHGTDLFDVYTDPNHPKNGVENARNMLGVARGLGKRAIARAVAVIHPTQLRRLGAMLQRQIDVGNVAVGELILHGSGYQFDPENPYDQYEAACETIGLHEQSLGENSKLDRPDGIDEHLSYAYAVRAYWAERFAEQGILNPSTADDTLRALRTSELAELYQETRR